MSTWMIFRTILRRHDLTARLGAARVELRKAQHDFVPHAQRLGRNQGRTILWKVAPKHAGDVKQRAAPADQAYIMRAITDHVTCRAQDGILQRNGIEKPAPFRGTIHLSALHDRTSKD